MQAGERRQTLDFQKPLLLRTLGLAGAKINEGECPLGKACC